MLLAPVGLRREPCRISQEITEFGEVSGTTDVYLRQQKKLEERLRTALRELYQIEVGNIVIEQPPEIRFGEYASPIAFELARTLRKAPRKIAEEIVAALETVEGFAKFEVAGAAYINARLDRGAAFHAISTGGRD